MRAVHSTLPVAANLSAMRSALSKPFCTKVAALSLPMCLHQLHILTLPPCRSDILSEPLDRFTSLRSAEEPVQGTGDCVQAVRKSEEGVRRRNPGSFSFTLLSSGRPFCRLCAPYESVASMLVNTLFLESFPTQTDSWVSVSRRSGMWTPKSRARSRQTWRSKILESRGSENRSLRRCGSRAKDSRRRLAKRIRKWCASSCHFTAATCSTSPSLQCHSHKYCTRHVHSRQ